MRWTRYHGEGLNTCLAKPHDTRHTTYAKGQGGVVASTAMTCAVPKGAQKTANPEEFL